MAFHDITVVELLTAPVAMFDGMAAYVAVLATAPYTVGTRFEFCADIPIANVVLGVNPFINLDAVHVVVVA